MVVFVIYFCNNLGYIKACMYPRLCSPTLSQAAVVAFFSNLAEVGLYGSMMVLLLFCGLEYIYYITISRK